MVVLVLVIVAVLVVVVVVGMVVVVIAAAVVVEVVVVVVVLVVVVNAYSKYYERLPRPECNLFFSLFSKGHGQPLIVHQQLLVVVVANTPSSKHYEPPSVYNATFSVSFFRRATASR